MPTVHRSDQQLHDTGDLPRPPKQSWTGVALQAANRDYICFTIDFPSIADVILPGMRGHMSQRRT
jgi:hypothetical protein